MDRTSKLLIALCFVLILVWPAISRMIWPPPPPSVVRAPTPTTGTNGLSQTPALREAKISSLAPTPQPAPWITELEASGAKAPTDVLENDFVTVHFSAQGGGIGKVIFKKFDVEDEPPAAINSQSPSASLDIAHIGNLDFGSEYQLSVDKAAGKAVATRESDELSVTKTFSFKEGKPYELLAEVRIVNKSGGKLTSVNQPVEVTSVVEKDGKKLAVAKLVQPVSIAIGTASPLTHLDSDSELGFEWLSSKDKHSTGALYNVTDKPWYAFWQKPLYKSFYRVFPKPEPKEGEPASAGSMQWVAVRNQFFTMAISPVNHSLVAVHADAFPFARSDLPYARKDQKAIFVYADLEQFTLQPGAERVFSYDIYAGPREYKVLASLGKQQELIMGYGWWTAICKALLWMMSLFHGWFGNWGIAIIVMTVAIKLIFWPLTNASTRSMKRMQALAPKIKELQEKYADDMEKRNLETMKLYREYGVNPIGGCLPMLVQIPIFFALFTMLRSMVELRGASFLWIKDLSMPDTVARIPFPEFHFLWWDLGAIPVNPMPILMMVANVWQMKLSPTTVTDRSQKIMMWTMPFLFFFICYNFSSALALYWTVQTLLQAGQTYLIQSKTGEPLEKVKRPQATGFSFARPVDKKKKK